MRGGLQGNYLELYIKSCMGICLRNCPEPSRSLNILLALSGVSGILTVRLPAF